MIIKMKFITRQFIQEHPDWLFLFGDNEERSGYGGQAREMRGEPNSIGVRTKAKPSNSKDSYWYDSSFTDNINMIDQDLSMEKQW